ncbi:MAG: hypothetical protein ACI86M_001890 [Saprospiraceae bacterium]
MSYTNIKRSNILSEYINNAMSKTEDKIKRPSLIWSLTEASRALLELGLHYPYRWASRLPKNGDKHPVLILPGFLASDTSTVPLRKFIFNLGYTVYGWGEGRNLASAEYLDSLIYRVEKLYAEHGQKVSLIGWSLGGVFARQIAKARPHMIKQVITLGSPFKGITKPNNAKWMYDLITKGEGISRVDPDLIKDIPLPAPLPTTAIYSKEDGVVPWEVCMEQMETAIHQNIQVRGSHLGLGVNPSVLWIIADRLNQSEDNWKHFAPGTKLEDYLFYPSIKTA